MESSYFHTSSIWDEWDCSAQSKGRRLLYRCNLDFKQSGGLIQWNAIAICKMQNVEDHLTDRKTHFDRRFGEPFKGPIIPCGAMVEYHPISPKDQARIHQFGKKLLPGIFLGYELIAGGILKDILMADLEELRKLDATDFYPRRIIAKEMLTRKKDDMFILPIADGTAKLLGKVNEIREPSLRQESTIRSEDLWRSSTRIGRVSTDRTNRWRSSPRRLVVDPRWLHLSSSQWTSSSSLCVDGRNIPYFTEMCWCYQVCSYWSGRHARKTHWRLSECRFEEAFVRFLERIHKVHSFRKRNLQKDKCGSGETDKDSIDYQTRSCVDRSLDENWENFSESRKTGMDKGKTKALHCSKTERNILFIDPDDREHEDTLKNARRKLKDLWLQPWRAR